MALTLFVGPPPIVTAAGVDSARIGDSVDVRGQGFIGVSKVSFGASGNASFVVTSDSTLTAVLDSAATSGPIRVSNPTGTGIGPFDFIVVGPNPRPRLVSVRDVRNDDGGWVLVRWEASDYDKPTNRTVTTYRVWRRALAATMAVARSTNLDALSAGALPHADTEFWESLAEIPAALLSGYAYVAPTLSDSTGWGNPFTAFAIQAVTLNREVFYFSNVDSGYSVDNVAPPGPSRFAAAYQDSATHLHWEPSDAADFATFRLYRGSSGDFVPATSNLIAAISDTGFVDPGAAGGFYKLSAMDVNGNESPFASLGPAQTIAVPKVGLTLLELHPSPNPAIGRALRVEYSLPSEQPARLELLDVMGRIVVAQDVGKLGVGPHSVDLAGAVRITPGVYLVRLRQGSNVRTTRVAVLD